MANFAKIGLPVSCENARTRSEMLRGPTKTNFRQIALKLTELEHFQIFVKYVTHSYSIYHFRYSANHSNAFFQQQQQQQRERFLSFFLTLWNRFQFEMDQNNEMLVQADKMKSGFWLGILTNDTNII